jgi:hypothetical protein
MGKKSIEQAMQELGIDKEEDAIFEDILRIRSVTEIRPKLVNVAEYTGDVFQLIPIGDLHLGSINCNRELVKATVEYILEKDNRHTIFMGDLAENATKVSVGLGVYEEDMHLREQLYYLRELMKPLAEQGRILGIHQGNHEFRSSCLLGIDPMEILADWLDVPYLGHQGYTVLTVKNQKYHIMTYHGSGGGGTSGGKVNAAEKGFKVNPTCDVYLSGHTHAKSAHETVTMVINENNEMVQKRQYYVACGSFLNYFGGYAEMKILAPSAIGAPIVEFYGNEKCISVRI